MAVSKQQIKRTLTALNKLEADMIELKRINLKLYKIDDHIENFFMIDVENEFELEGLDKYDELVRELNYYNEVFPIELVDTDFIRKKINALRRFLENYEESSND